MRKCKNCGKEIPSDAHARRIFCNDACRVGFHFKKNGAINLGSVKPFNENSVINISFSDEDKKWMKAVLKSFKKIRKSIKDYKDKIKQLKKS